MFVRCCSGQPDTIPARNLIRDPKRPLMKGLQPAHTRLSEKYQGAAVFRKRLKPQGPQRRLCPDIVLVTRLLS